MFCFKHIPWFIKYSSIGFKIGDILLKPHNSYVPFLQILFLKIYIIYKIIDLYYFGKIKYHERNNKRKSISFFSGIRNHF